MLVPDINLLVYAHRSDVAEHAAYQGWLEAALSGEEPVALCGHVLAGFVRIVTHPRIFMPPSPLPEALRFVDAVRAAPAALEPPLDRSHADAFVRACAEGGVKGALVSDAYLAGIVMSLDAELVTADRGFARFPGLRWRHPLQS